MPNYEYRCLNCNRKFEVYISYSDYGKHKTECPYCESAKVQRRIGRLRFARSEESRLENLADPSNLEGLEDDPESLARMMRQMSNEMGEDLRPNTEDKSSLRSRWAADFQPQRGSLFLGLIGALILIVVLFFLFGRGKKTNSGDLSMIKGKLAEVENK